MAIFLCSQSENTSSTYKNFYFTCKPVGAAGVTFAAPIFKFKSTNIPSAVATEDHAIPIKCEYAAQVGASVAGVATTDRVDDVEILPCTVNERVGGAWGTEGADFNVVGYCAAVCGKAAWKFSDKLFLNALPAPHPPPSVVIHSDFTLKKVLLYISMRGTTEVNSMAFGPVP